MYSCIHVLISDWNNEKILSRNLHFSYEYENVYEYDIFL